MRSRAASASVGARFRDDPRALPPPPPEPPLAVDRASASPLRPALAAGAGPGDDARLPPAFGDAFFGGGGLRADSLLHIS